MRLATLIRARRAHNLRWAAVAVVVFIVALIIGLTAPGSRKWWALLPVACLLVAYAYGGRYSSHSMVHPSAGPSPSAPSATSYFDPNRGEFGEWVNPEDDEHDHNQFLRSLSQMEANPLGIDEYLVALNEGEYA